MNAIQRQQFAMHFEALCSFAKVDLNLPDEIAICTLECINHTLMSLLKINETHLSEMRNRMNDVTSDVTAGFYTDASGVEFQVISDDNSTIPDSYIIPVEEDTATDSDVMQALKSMELPEMERERMAPLTLADLTLDENSVQENANEPIYLEHYTIPPEQEYGESWLTGSISEEDDLIHPNVTIRSKPKPYKYL